MSRREPYPLRLWAYRAGLNTMGALISLRVPLDVGHPEPVPSDPCLIVSNHASHFDPALLGLGFKKPVRFLAKEELFRGPVGVAMRLWGQIPVRRATGIGRSGAILEARKVLAAGWDVGLFVEGTRSRDGVFRRESCRTGAATIAHLAKATVLPAGVSGTHRAFPAGARFPRPHPVSVRFGPPVDTAEFFSGPLGRETAHKFTLILAAAIANLLDPLQLP
ncbi:1-acyl-sn-glycerol-3-phosphate acyltransferase [bacterium]|nr:1-acyl-sn-glycerol-3-phosphate acyltransferase [bacterium]